MKRLSIFLFLAALIISCNNTSSSGEDEIIRIGTWDANLTQLKADWVGRQSTPKNKTVTMQGTGDSLFYDTPDGVSLVAEHMNEGFPHERFTLIFTDSTLTDEDVDMVTVDSVYAEITGGYSYGPVDGRFTAAFGGKYSCENDTTNLEHLNFGIVQGADTTTYTFYIAGMNESLRRIVCIYD